ncbi:MAG: glucokinase [Rhodospirillales bacterium]|jgi:glucokinase|nr:glucokinase [Rhodospirillales bacterium]
MDRDSRPAALVADIGGTNARFALVGADGSVGHVRSLASRDYTDPAAAAQAYLAEMRPPTPPRRAAIGVASAISGDRVELTNVSWSFSIAETRRRLGLDSLNVVNDVVALALALPDLDDTQRATVGEGQAVPGAPMAAVAPGTGLGVGALTPFGDGWAPVASEAGHAPLAVRDDVEIAILAVLRRRFGHVSGERALSGPGLVNLYHAFCELDGIAADPEMTPAGVTKGATDGDNPQCAAAARLFSTMLGSFAGGMALTFCARGGVFIGGGVVRRMGTAFDGAAFRRRFIDMGRFTDYVAAIPTFLVTHPTPALLGLAHAV